MIVFHSIGKRRLLMPRYLSQPLSRLFPRRPPTEPLSVHRRCSSSKTRKAELIELEIDQASSSQISPEETIGLGIRKLEDAINSIVLRRAAPDWLPFLPGYSFLPPHAKAGRYTCKPAGGLIEVVGRLASSEGGRIGRALPLNFATEEAEEEGTSLTSPRGWPSFSFFIEGSTMPIQSVQMVEVELQIQGGGDAED